VRSILAAITGEPVLCLLIAAALTWAAHSSVTVVLLVMSLAWSHFITPTAALALSSVPTLAAPSIRWSGGQRGDNPASRRLPVGNLINRLVGCALVLPFLHPIADALIAL
jgi:phosphate:Na+ symporter